MIVNNTCPNVRIFSYKDASKNVQQFFLFPGVNGEVPEAVMDDKMFKEQVELDLLKIITPKKAIPVDATRATMSPDNIAKVPDNDVVAVMLELDERKALTLLADIVKRPTLVALKAQERRGNVAAAIEKQIDDIDKLNLPTRK